MKSIRKMMGTVKRKSAFLFTNKIRMNGALLQNQGKVVKCCQFRCDGHDNVVCIEEDVC